MAFEVNPASRDRPSPGEMLDALAELDEQALDALDHQHQALARRVAALEATVEMLSALLLTCHPRSAEDQ